MISNPSSQGDLGDFPEQPGPESTAGSQDPSTPEDPGSPEDPGNPEDPNGPVGVAYNPEGDYSRSGSLPGVIGPGGASYDPEGGSNAGSVKVPGFKDRGCRYSESRWNRADWASFFREQYESNRVNGASILAMEAVMCIRRRC